MTKIAVIFDMNGTIVDSEVAHWKAYYDVFIEYDIDYSQKEFSLDRTSKGKKLDYVLKKHGREDLIKDIEEIKRKKDIIFRSKTKDLIKPMPHVREALEHLKNGYVKLILDSTSAIRDIEHMLEDHDLNGFFHLITSGDMEWNNKKYGKISKTNRFQYIADELNIENSNCIVVGDASKDIVAAKNNKMKVISVPNQHTRNNDFSEADLILKDLSELNLDLINKLLIERYL